MDTLRVDFMARGLAILMEPLIKVMICSHKTPKHEFITHVPIVGKAGYFSFMI